MNFVLVHENEYFLFLFIGLTLVIKIKFKKPVYNHPIAIWFNDDDNDLAKGNAIT